MTEEEIRNLQKKYNLYGCHSIQSQIDIGTCWHLEGFYGRRAMQSLEEGYCFLPNEDHSDCYGNIIPSRDKLEKGTLGTLEKSSAFWTGFIENPEDYMDSFDDK